MSHIERIYHLARKITTPHASNSGVIVAVSFLVIFVIFLADVNTSAEFRFHLHILYVFPLAAIAINSEKLWPVGFSLLLAFLFQLVNIFTKNTTLVPIITDALVSFFSSALTVTLSFSIRENYIELRNTADTDPLTGLRNRRSFYEIASMEINRQKRYGGVFSLALVDLDDFKQLNDSQGHLIGDEALRLFARILTEHVRESDSIARIGGDEFVILMPSTSAEDCERLCTTLSERIQHSMKNAGFHMTASIGGITCHHTPQSIAEVLQQADGAMYAAKNNGKGHAICR